MSFIKALCELTTVYGQKLYVDASTIVRASTAKPELNKGEPCTLLGFVDDMEPALVKGHVQQILYDCCIEWVAVPRPRAVPKDDEVTP